MRDADDPLIPQAVHTDAQADRALRPRSFAEYVGQKQC